MTLGIRDALPVKHRTGLRESAETRETSNGAPYELWNRSTLTIPPPSPMPPPQLLIVAPASTRRVTAVCTLFSSTQAVSSSAAAPTAASHPLEATHWIHARATSTRLAKGMTRTPPTDASGQEERLVWCTSSRRRISAVADRCLKVNKGSSRKSCEGTALIQNLRWSRRRLQVTKRAAAATTPDPRDGFEDNTTSAWEFVPWNAKELTPAALL